MKFAHKFNKRVLARRIFDKEYDNCKSWYIEQISYLISLNCNFAPYHGGQTNEFEQSGTQLRKKNTPNTISLRMTKIISIRHRGIDSGYTV
ncbi:MAG: hypothetical protein KAJ44_00515 [Thermoplasmatales archaeon]|nr:hypothetical protein [Thermoplasmatales archaeon]